MRWSEWRVKAPFRFGRTQGPGRRRVRRPGPWGPSWIRRAGSSGGDVPIVRYTMLVPTASGLVQVNVRVAVPGEGPRAGGKVVRWNRVQLGELGVEIQGGHRLVTLQVETQVLTGADATADAIASFAQSLFAAVDGRPVPEAIKAKKPRPGRAGTTAKTGTRARAGGRRLGPRESPFGRGRHADPGRHLRPRRRHRGLRDLVGRGARRIRRRSRANVDGRRPGGRHGRELRGLGSDHARAARPGRTRTRDRAGDRRWRRRTLSSRGCPAHRWRGRGGPAHRGRLARGRRVLGACRCDRCRARGRSA